MKKLILIILGAILVALAVTSTARACDDNWGNDQYNENDYE
jgi:hypothetical protein